VDTEGTTATRLRAVIARADRLLARGVTGSGLTRTEFSVLGALARAGELRLTDLVERERLHPTMLSRIVGRLVGAGWAARVADPRDGRAALISVTDTGSALYRQLQETRSRRIGEYLDGLAPEQAALLTAALPVLEGLTEHLARDGAEPGEVGR
jgi:DNA-binding MarR family transcriptional regulator